MLSRIEYFVRRFTAVDKAIDILTSKLLPQSEAAAIFCQVVSDWVDACIYDTNCAGHTRNDVYVRELCVGNGGHIFYRTYLSHSYCRRCGP